MQIVYDMTHPPFQYWLISKLIRHRKYKLMNQQLSKSKFDLVTNLSLVMNDYPNWNWISFECINWDFSFID